MSDVHHPEYGEGEVVTYRRNGRVAIVDFDSRPMPTHVSTRELIEVDGDEPGEADRSPSLLERGGPAREGTRDRARSSRVLEAMRLGVVPDSNLDLYTVGRDVELSQIEADLSRVQSSGGAVRAFLGDYGTGKTHLLRTVRERALDEGYLVADVTLDPRETPPSHPKRVYRAIVESLTYPDQPDADGRGLRPLFDRAAGDEAVRDQFDVRPSKGDRDERLEAGMHLYLTPALLYYEQLTADDPADELTDEIEADDVDRYVNNARSLLLEWIEGYPTISNREINDQLSAVAGAHPWLYSLMDYRPWSRIYGYLISGIATLARTTGYPGLILLVDEAERYSVLSKENREFARYLFKALSLATVGTEDVPFDRSELTSLGGIGVLKELPPRYADEPGLYTVLAMTPHDRGVDALHEAVPPGKVCDLAPFDGRDYAELASKVCDFYASAHPDWELPEAFVTRATSLLEDARDRGFVDSPRAAMKFLVEVLDIARLTPDDLDRVVRGVERRTTTFKR
ncbi:MAG: BREX system ATP-binding domain-containing protein [Bradymonadaceae bacterium]